MSRFTLLLGLVLVSGCQFNTFSNRKATDVTINDTGPDAFRITTVDGKSPKRYRNAIHTVQPWVLVEPGTHTFSRENSSQPITAEIEPGKQYQTILQDGSPAIVLRND